VDAIHFLVTSADYPGIHLRHNSQALHLSIDAFTGTPPAADWKRPRRTWLQQVEEDMGLPISACRFATLDRSLWRSDRYDLQLVKRSSE